MNDIFEIVLSIIIASIGIYLLVKFQRKKSYLIKNGICVSGTISDINTEYIGSGFNAPRPKFPIVTFKTIDNNIINEKSNISGNYSIGEEVKVYYNPNNPKDFILKRISAT